MKKYLYSNDFFKENLTGTTCNGESQNVGIVPNLCTNQWLFML